MTFDVDLDTIRIAIQFLLSISSLVLSILIYRQSRRTNALIASKIVDVLNDGIEDMEDKQQTSFQHISSELAALKTELGDLKKRLDEV